jgi:alanine racemase
MYERASARIDLGAVAHNVGVLRRAIGPGIELSPVLKADGYGHGLAGCAPAAIAAGVDRIAVATAREAAAVRELDPDVPILVLGALSPEESELAIAAGGAISVWEPGFAEALDARAAAAGRTVRVHVKYDTGMGRLGDFDPGQVLATARRVDASANLELEALWTHFATADEADRSFMHRQLDRLNRLAARAKAEFPEVRLHAANSAATLTDPATRLDLVRPGVALYGMDPFGSDPADHDLRPVLSLHSYVATVKRFEPGMSAGYGRTWTAEQATTVVTVPVGYGDGVRRGLSNRGEVLIGGVRHPIAGTISMDNLTVAVGDHAVSVGDEVTLIGEQDGERITAEQVARTLDTINYEVTCGVSPRVPRQCSGEPA